MKPGFALALSPKEITLLHNVADEWHELGRVTPDAPDLAAAMADLREQALAKEPEGPHCRIIISDEQIRYLSVETGTVDQQTREQLVRAALEGATPYAVSDLRYAISAQGTVTHIAAVALETLDEARQFTLRHGFIPISYAASPIDKAFSGEAAFDYPAPATDQIKPSDTAPDDRMENISDALAPTMQPAPETSVEPASVSLTARRDNSRPRPPEIALKTSATAPSATPDAQAKSLDQRAPHSAVASTTADKPHVEPEPTIIIGAQKPSEIGERRQPPLRPVAIGLFLLSAAIAAWAMLPAKNGTQTPSAALQEVPAEAARTTAPVTPGDPIESMTTTLEVPRKTPMQNDLQLAAPYTPPHGPKTPSVIGLGDLYIASTDRSDITRTAAELPQPNDPQTDSLPGAASTPAAGESVTPNPDRLVTPSPEGTLTPDGVLVFLGRPPAIPPAVPTRFAAAPKTDTTEMQLAAMRPRLRPDTLVPSSEPSTPDHHTGAEPVSISPPLRPDSLAAQVDRLIEEQLHDIDPSAAEPTVPDAETATASAIPRSLKPNARPTSIAASIAKSRDTSKPKQPAAIAAPATVVPKIPSSASVARQATQSKAINLRRVNLIGVYGPPANRRALIRLSSGRYKKVKIGDTVDGGRVVAIGQNNVHYQKGGRGITLSMPSS
ncbi:hypothetical protein [Pontibaca salina]|uniref:Type IV pilus biogenesis n=1 Tax=Pontibaca salina TaxID=2795731 RepID=A0A934HMU1_9RHOB|nr:hypothetical protein [Pontibaca salina]MBI6629836.1 hypothetical protein [Pontibaca salina]